MAAQTRILPLKVTNIFLNPEKLIHIIIRSGQRNTPLQHQFLWCLVTSKNGKDLGHLENLLAEAKQAACMPLPCSPACLASCALVALLLTILFHKEFLMRLYLHLEMAKPSVGKNCCSSSTSLPGYLNFCNSYD